MDKAMQALEKWWYIWLAFLAGVGFGVSITLWLTGFPSPLG
jgi:hypothetical protein